MQNFYCEQQSFEKSLIQSQLHSEHETEPVNQILQCLGFKKLQFKVSLSAVSQECKKKVSRHDPKRIPALAQMCSAFFWQQPSRLSWPPPHPAPISPLPSPTSAASSSSSQGWHRQCHSQQEPAPPSFSWAASCPPPQLSPLLPAAFSSLGRCVEKSWLGDFAPCVLDPWGSAQDRLLHSTPCRLRSWAQRCHYICRLPSRRGTRLCTPLHT
jgi:hypothetical protein